MRKDLIELGKYLLENHLAWGNSGNISARQDHQSMIITASGTDMGNLSMIDFATVDIRTGTWNGNVKPSKEVPMHVALYTERPDINVVIHSSPFWSTMMACSNLRFDSNLFIESMYYTERIARVKYEHPGSRELGEAVREKAKNANIIILENHGVLVYDSNFREARMRLETLEMVSRMVITASGTGVSLVSLDKETVQDFLENSGYKPRDKSIY